MIVSGREGTIRVIVVEDDPLTGTLRRVLEARGFGVDTFDRGPDPVSFPDDPSALALVQFDVAQRIEKSTPAAIRTRAFVSNRNDWRNSRRARGRKS